MRTAVVALFLLMAGCADEAPEAQPASLAPTEDDLNLFQSGGIEGLVLDETVRPIQGAAVTIPGMGREAVTDNQGTFLLGGLLPGATYIEIDAQGYKLVGAEVLVPEEGTVKVRVTLVRIPSEDPWQETQKFTGHATFTFNPGASAVGCTCSFQAPFGGAPETVIIEAARTTPAGDPTGLLTKPHYYVNIRDMEGGNLANGQQPDPFNLRFEEGALGRVIMDVEPGEYWPSTGVEFEVFATAFHNEAAPDGWSIRGVS